MKKQFKMNPIGSEVSSIKKEKMTISKVWYIWFFAGIATTSLGMVIIFWHTTVFRDVILSTLEIKNGTQTFLWWERPPVSPLLRVKIFNYTNVEDYEVGIASKLHVEEVGPYIYRETLTRVNVRLNENGTISYQEKRTHKREGGRPDDELIRVPNVPLIAVIKKVKEFNRYMDIGLTITLSLMGVKPFKLVTVEEYLWGYSDNLLETLMSIMSLAEPLPYNKFGMLMARAGLSEDVLTIHTGSDDINKIGTFESINGMESRNIWNDEECDKLEGTDGSVFPPNLVRDPNATLAIYTKDMCRKFPMRYSGNSTAFDIPTLRYKPIKDIFTSSNTTNSCFCQKSSNDNLEKIHNCPPAGLFNMSACSYGLPLLVSFPHFYKGEKSLLNHVQGLNPRQEVHESYVDIHPRMGVMMGGWSRIQINTQVSILKTIPLLGSLKDEMILPLIWFEIGVDDIPEMVLGSLRAAYYTASTLESTLQWGSLLCTILSMFAMAFMMKKQREIERPKWQNNVSLKVGC